MDGWNYFYISISSPGSHAQVIHGLLLNEWIVWVRVRLTLLFHWWMISLNCTVEKYVGYGRSLRLNRLYFLISPPFRTDAFKDLWWELEIDRQYRFPKVRKLSKRSVTIDIYTYNNSKNYSCPISLFPYRPVYESLI